MKARQLGAQSWADAQRIARNKESEGDFRSWLPYVIGVWAGLLILLVKAF